MEEKKLIDPVCGMKVNADTKYKAGYHGETYYFCNEEDKKMFQHRPAAYAHKAGKGMSGGSS